MVRKRKEKVKRSGENVEKYIENKDIAKINRRSSVRNDM
jgi:hypothetical protein